MTLATHDARRIRLALIGLAVILLLAIAARLLIGSTVGWSVTAQLQLRTDRVVKALTVGVGLAVSGVLLQALLRNPLASPYILGASSGAALGVMVTTWLATVGALQLFPKLPGLTNALAALIGASGTLFVVYLISQKRGLVDPLGLLLTGVIVSAINGALIMLINYMVPNLVRANIATYMMGYLDEDVGVTALFHLGPLPVTLVEVAVVVVAGGTLLSIGLARSLDVVTLSDAEAESVGLSVGRLRLGLFVLAGTLTGATVVLAGPIGFVGLICPHLVRLMVGPSHRALLVGSALAGGALMVGADAGIKAIALAVPSLSLLPIGVLTAAIGGPVFLLMLRPRLGRLGGEGV